jgi:hypothetical protein
MWQRLKASIRPTADSPQRMGAPIASTCVAMANKGCGQILQALVMLRLWMPKPDASRRRLGPSALFGELILSAERRMSNF